MRIFPPIATAIPIRDFVRSWLDSSSTIEKIEEGYKPVGEEGCAIIVA